MTTTKICTSCKKELLRECFHRNRSRRDGLTSTCKGCNVARAKTWVKRNRVRHNRNCNRAKTKIKTEVFSHYCEGEIRCKCCPETDLNLLTIDHINGGGGRHRRLTGMRTGHNGYGWLKRNKYPEGFQVLCWNCQFRKRAQEMMNKNPTERQRQTRDYSQSIKAQCMERYGQTCPCGEADMVVLTLDHVNDDGAAHRLSTGTKGYAFYLHLRKHGFPNDPPLQVLCLNCQYRKRAKNEGEAKWAGELTKTTSTSSTLSAASSARNSRGCSAQATCTA